MTNIKINYNGQEFKLEYTGEFVTISDSNKRASFKTIKLQDTSIGIPKKISKPGVGKDLDKEDEKLLRLVVDIYVNNEIATTEKAFVTHNKYGGHVVYKGNAYNFYPRIDAPEKVQLLFAKQPSETFSVEFTILPNTKIIAIPCNPIQDLEKQQIFQQIVKAYVQQHGKDVGSIKEALKADGMEVTIEEDIATLLKIAMEPSSTPTSDIFSSVAHLVIHTASANNELDPVQVNEHGQDEVDTFQLVSPTPGEDWVILGDDGSTCG